MKALVVLSVFVALSAALLSAPAGSAVTDSSSFRAEGVVADPNAPTGPVPPDAAAAFVLNPVTEASGSAESHVGDDGLKIHETAGTTYLKLGDDGRYHEASRDEVVVASQEVRVKGARITDSGSTATFVADTIWNPPNEPATGTHSLPACFAESGMRSGSFNVIAKVKTNRVHYPCTGLSGYPGGFTLTFLASETDLTQQDDPAQPGVMNPAEDAAIDAYGGQLEIYITPFTEYIHDGVASDYATTVVRNEIVQAKGTYYYVDGAWMFFAEKVFNPARDAPTSFRPTAGFEAVRSGSNSDGSSTYQGPTTGPNFPAPDGRFSADITWTMTLSGWQMSGTYRIDNGGSTFIEGTLNGAVVANSFDATLTITGAGGFWVGATGDGTMTGSIVPEPGSLVPEAINGTADWTIAK